MSNVELIIPEELTEYMEVLSTVISPAVKDIGILIMSEDYYPTANMPTIHLFQITKSESKFQVEKDLGAFTFHDYISAKMFVEGFPNMSAFDLLMMQNNQNLSFGTESATQH